MTLAFISMTGFSKTFNMVIIGPDFGNGYCNSVLRPIANIVMVTSRSLEHSFCNDAK